MVRLGLDGPSLDALATWAGSFAVSVPATPAPSRANVEAGERLFSQRGCGGCHTFGRLHLGPGTAAAPDLRWARDRMEPDTIAAWVQNPAAVSGAATMPAMGLTADEAVKVRDYLVLADPDAGAAPAPSPVATGLPVPAEPRWADVEARVFGKICTHCHMDPAQNEGRAGPGNAGGFGWPATGLELQTRAGVARERDRVLAALERRYAEEPRDHVGPGGVPAAVKRPALPGMPRGQPALSAEDLELVKRWYAAGAPE
jgi:mono/diheme cytochrome c family protein